MRAGDRSIMQVNARQRDAPVHEPAADAVEAADVAVVHEEVAPAAVD